MVFQRIDEKRAYQLVAEQLEKAILSGALKPRHRTPPEWEMKDI
jgi:DNA-binding FadR family transcriptional regulator